VVLVGETGTGKELFARALHSLSRRLGPWVAINCAAIPEQLAEAELFGYRKGAFSGAINDAPGHFRAAKGGTLFLDEVVELSPAVQAKVLRALESHSVTPLGQSQPVPTDVRIVCAAQSPLADAVERGALRADLYARLRGAEIVLPPLRARREEIAQHFLGALREATGGRQPLVAPDVIERLCLYDWPMNVRQLLQAARQVAVFAGNARHVGMEHLPPEITIQRRSRDAARGGDEGATQAQAGGAAKRRPRVAAQASRAEEHRRAVDRRDETDRERLRAALRVEQGNVSLAARRIGISRQRAYRIMTSMPELDLDELREPGSARKPPADGGYGAN
jgi:transcriptional regulator with PAS, ATPase and Fis domain